MALHAAVKGKLISVIGDEVSKFVVKYNNIDVKRNNI